MAVTIVRTARPVKREQRFTGPMPVTYCDVCSCLWKHGGTCIAGSVPADELQILCDFDTHTLYLVRISSVEGMRDGFRILGEFNDSVFEQPLVAIQAVREHVSRG